MRYCTGRKPQTVVMSGTSFVPSFFSLLNRRRKKRSVDSDRSAGVNRLFPRAVYLPFGGPAAPTSIDDGRRATTVSLGEPQRQLPGTIDDAPMEDHRRRMTTKEAGGGDSRREWHAKPTLAERKRRGVTPRRARRRPRIVQSITNYSINTEIALFSSCGLEDASFISYDLHQIRICLAAWRVEVEDWGEFSQIPPFILDVQSTTSRTRHLPHSSDFSTKFQPKNIKDRRKRLLADLYHLSHAEVP